jgi:pimeloyl-ACP methyl ester carboxylesterase
MDQAQHPPEVAAPLAPFAGEPPPAPAWFEKAVAVEPERSSVEVRGANIEWLAWGERGKQGLILIHGASAHADWWSFIAPFFADGFRVAALSLSGMGGSDWRPSYDYDTFAAEIDAVAEAAGLNEGPEKPVYIGHSFGGAVVYASALAYPERMTATIMIDTGFGGPPKDESAQDAAKQDVGPPRRPMGRVYATLAEALARFRFLPAQAPRELYIADFIARRSLKRAPMPDGSGEGWTWKFDPDLFPRLDRSHFRALIDKAMTGRALHIYGEHSKVIERHGGPPKLLDSVVRSVSVPQAEHHVMVDQPLALISAIRTALAAWSIGPA